MRDVQTLTGKVAIVTGGTRGIGLYTAMGLATVGAEVIILGSNPEQGGNAVSFIKKRVPRANISFTKVDFGSLQGIADFARAFNEKGVGLDILVNNAGIYAREKLWKTVDGFESTFGINYLAPFSLTAQLLPSLRKANAPRVVNVSSLAAYYAKIHFDDIQYERAKWYLFSQVYSQSKLAILAFTEELQRRSDAKGWGLTALSVMPGLVRTRLLEKEIDRYSTLGQIFKSFILPCISNSAKEGAKYSLFAATSPDITPGALYGPPYSYVAYRGPIRKIWIPRLATDPKVGGKLWEISEKLTKVRWG